MAVHLVDGVTDLIEDASEKIALKALLRMVIMVLNILLVSRQDRQ